MFQTALSSSQPRSLVKSQRCTLDWPTDTTLNRCTAVCQLSAANPMLTPPRLSGRSSTLMTARAHQARSGLNGLMPGLSTPGRSQASQPQHRMEHACIGDVAACQCVRLLMALWRAAHRTSFAGCSGPCQTFGSAWRSPVATASRAPVAAACTAPRGPGAMRRACRWCPSVVQAQVPTTRMPALPTLFSAPTSPAPGSWPCLPPAPTGCCASA